MNRNKLKTWVIGVLFVPVFSGCGTRQTGAVQAPKKTQAAAVANIEKLGGKVTFDEEAVGQPVYGVDFSETKIGDDSLKTVEGLTELNVLTLSHTGVTDAGLRHIEGLTQLRIVLLNDTRLTDAGLEHIRPLVHLEELSLDDTQVSNAGLKQIARLGGLERLSLNGTRITGF